MSFFCPVICLHLLHPAVTLSLQHGGAVVHAWVAGTLLGCSLTPVQSDTVTLTRLTDAATPALLTRTANAC